MVFQEEELKKQFDLICSVKGIGEQMALNFIISTDGFKRFKNGRQFASYCGVAPYPYISGTSIYGKNKVSHLANKKLKSLLNMCAVSAIQHAPEMKLFYQQKVAEGKNKMSVINIVRNKLIHRVFSVVKRGTPYVELKKYVA